MTTRTCSRFAACESWSWLGAHAEVPPELRAHLPDCEECGAFVAEVLAVREAFAKPLAAATSDRRYDEMRFALMAAARATQRERELAAPARRFGLDRKWALAAVAALLAAVLAVVVLHGSSSPSQARVTFAEVRLQPKATGRRTQAAPSEIYSLYDGTASFVVEHLAKGQSYRVVVGKDRVEVRGTRFEVEAQRGELASVRVKEGLVLVYSNGPRVAELSAGGSWSRPHATPAAPPPPSAVADTSNDNIDHHATEKASSPPAKSGAAPPAPGPNAAHSAGGSDVPLRQRDSTFRSAWRLLKSGNAAEAARAFDALSRDPSLDAERRADSLYWAARAHESAGSPGSAQARAEELVENLPNAWHAPEAALLVAESLIRKGDRAEAKRWLERARAAGSAEVRARAEALLEAAPAP